MKRIIATLAISALLACCSTEKSTSAKLDFDADSVGITSIESHKMAITLESVIRSIEIDSVEIIPVRKDSSGIARISLYGISSSSKSSNMSSTDLSMTESDCTATCIKEKQDVNTVRETRSGRLNGSSLAVILVLAAIFVFIVRMRK